MYSDSDFPNSKRNYKCKGVRMEGGSVLEIWKKALVYEVQV